MTSLSPEFPSEGPGLPDQLLFWVYTALCHPHQAGLGQRQILNVNDRASAGPTHEGTLILGLG